MTLLRRLTQLLLAGLIAATWIQPATPALSAGVPAFDHVVVIVMENHSYNEIIGSSSAPYINSLTASGALFTNYVAVTHPSLPNYLSLTGGSTYGITSDCTTCWVSASNIADRMESSGSTWKAYMESMPSACYVGDSSPYAQKHNPFIYYNNIRTNTSRCQSHVVPYSQLSTDLRSTTTTPNYAFITPNMCNDMHDCSVGTGDAWLKQQVPAILGSPAFTTQHSLLALTWDEDDSSAGNQVPLIFLGYGVRGGYRSGAAYNHYSLLHTLEAARGATTLTTADAGAALISDAFGSVSACTGLTVAAAPGSPASSGMQITVSAGTTACPNPRYQFWMLAAGSTSWQSIQGYSSTPSYQWNSTGALTGTEQFGVWARDASTSIAYDTFTSIPYSVVAPSCGGVVISAAPLSPIAHGTGAHVTVTGVASSCTHLSPQYEFWMLAAGSSTWRMIRGYSTSATYDWNTTGAAAGTERFGVWVRDAASRAAYDTFTGIPYTLS